MAKLNQEQLLAIFNELKKELKPYEKGSIKARFDIEGKYDLWSEKPGMTIQNKVRNEVAFAALILQSSYVGFYIMPIYSDDGKSKLSPELLKKLKGKTCFHITAVDESLLKDIGAAMKAVYEHYSKKRWV